jgi:hypothetical protein
MKRYEEAIADYDAELRINPANPHFARRPGYRQAPERQSVGR